MINQHHANQHHANQHHANWTGLACLLAISCALFLQNLSTPYITLWDEAVHVNVIKNLAEHCCLPQLHRSANIGTDYRRWTNNSLWLHKPLLPFYVTAGIDKLLGGSLWALRVPGAIFAWLTAVVIYFIGRNFLNDHIGLGVIEHERNLLRSLERFGNLLPALPQKVEHISAHEIHTLAASLGVNDRSIKVVYKVALDQLLE
jgi:hypothetical protein